MRFGIDYEKCLILSADLGIRNDDDLWMKSNLSVTLFDYGNSLRVYPEEVTSFCPEVPICFSSVQTFTGRSSCKTPPSSRRVNPKVMICSVALRELYYKSFPYLEQGLLKYIKGNQELWDAVHKEKKEKIPQIENNLRKVVRKSIQPYWHKNFWVVARLGYMSWDEVEGNPF